IRSWNFCELHVRKSCAAPKFCHLRSTWTRGSRSTQSFYSPISSGSSHWDFGPDDEIETWTNSLSVRAPFRGGLCFLLSSPRNRRQAISRRRNHGGDMALPFPVAAGESQYLHLGNYFRHCYHDDLYGGWRN